MSKQNSVAMKGNLVFGVDPTVCPFREFRDNELGLDQWGLGPAVARATVSLNKTGPKPSADHTWVDDQTQPLPRSVRQYLHRWVRAEDLANSRWDDDVVVFEENSGRRMSVIEYQLTYTQVLMRSSFCRRVLSTCFILERAEGLTVEHQWENFSCSLPEGWRAWYHIYSPGVKSGGGLQHKPMLSRNGENEAEGWRAWYHIYSPGVKSGGGLQHKPTLWRNGCYLVRLFYLGTWRCVWVSDQVPVDATEAPLLPFSPLLCHTPAKPGSKARATTVIASEVHLWPLLLCKALLKLAAPDMNSDEEFTETEDEPLEDFDIFHALTGCLHMKYDIRDAESLWRLMYAEMPVFTWEDDDETQASTVKSKSNKKIAAKETVSSRSSVGTISLVDTRSLAPYVLPGIGPAHALIMLVTAVRDLPLKKPLPEPEVALWKYYRWVDWARQHGLYELYDCPRARFLKVKGLMKLSYAPHLLEIQSTESIFFGFREEQDRTIPTKKIGKENSSKPQGSNSQSNQTVKEELREWVEYYEIQKYIQETALLFYPSMFGQTSACSSPPVRITKAAPNRAIDMPAPRSGPLYLQIDGPDVNRLKVSLSMLHPRVLINSGVQIEDYIEPSYILLEQFDWFGGCEIPIAKGYVQTSQYSTVEINLKPGRHYFRLWVHCRTSWHMMLLSESALLLGGQDAILAAAVKERPWAAKFLSNFGIAFTNWIRVNKSNASLGTIDREFYKAYQPDLHWDPEEIGYETTHLHWMFRQALQSHLAKRLNAADFRSACAILRHHFCDPDFGFPPKPLPGSLLRRIVALDPCDCGMLEEEIELDGELLEEQTNEEKPVVPSSVMTQLLEPPKEPIRSQVCELATEELPCGTLKEERENVLKQHDAATYLQARWRGAWARRCLRGHMLASPESVKLLMEHAFGNLESLSALMNEFFFMYPGAKSAYSVASALSGSYGLAQCHGTCTVTPRCKWIPYFQAVFYCHGPVKVHFDIQSSLPHSTFAVYNNDTGGQMPQAYNAHRTFNFDTNNFGYTVLAHGTIPSSTAHTHACSTDGHWQLTVLSSVEGLFHVCDNDFDDCKEQPIAPACKLRINEIFVPNRRNILGGILVSVTRHEAISFRAAATSADLEMVAILRTTVDEETKELARCSGKGEIYWPFIQLQPTPAEERSSKKKLVSYASLIKDPGSGSARNIRNQKRPTSGAGAKNKSSTRLRDRPAPVEPKTYSIEVIAPSGWPLTAAQWMRVDEIRNTHGSPKLDVSPKKSAKVAPPPHTQPEPLPGDAFVELECSVSTVGGALARRDDLRDLQLAAAIRSWDATESGRNLRGAAIRQEFRNEFLDAPSVPSLHDTVSLTEETLEKEFYSEDDTQASKLQQGPTPTTVSEALEANEEDARYLTMPEQLKDKFIPLDFLPFCLKEKSEENSVTMTPDMAEAAGRERNARIEVSVQRMRELQQYNEAHILDQQKRRARLLETLFVDSQWPSELAAVFRERDDAIAQEILARSISATKKKQDAKVPKK